MSQPNPQIELKETEKEWKELPSKLEDELINTFQKYIEYFKWNDSDALVNPRDYDEVFSIRGLIMEPIRKVLECGDVGRKELREL